ncbi:class E sortase [Rhodococcus sp. OK302]|uniref:class E sortase n=1 Tax=Rhodococcus sp. OK302 TaxID=1882769 RepID=UPI000B941DEA|nr:class E sortase [Rhodococcus sp. OK302]OYD61133.1 LPXTG-site transpeptidase (sortase) family protein [Rhodococcus sp. OK302]
MDRRRQPSPYAPTPIVLETTATRAQKWYRGFGDALLTLGLIGALFIVYEVYWTDISSDRKQRTVTEQLDQVWAQQDSAQFRSAAPEIDGPVGFAKIRIPRFGSDFQMTVVKGTSDADLEVGPGQYEGSADPGQVGNFAVAGHRVGKGSPFNDIDALQTCDAVVIETLTVWYTYRVLPSAAEASEWGTERKPARCTADPTPVTSLPAPYQRALGQQVVDPNEVGVISPVPMDPSYAEAPEGGVALLTLTTCTPRFSATDRLVVQAMLVNSTPKDPQMHSAPTVLSEG